MLRFIKICIYSTIGILLVTAGLTLYTAFNRYEHLDISEKVGLIDEGNAIRGGETTQDIVINKETTLEGRDHLPTSNVSDKTPVDAIEFLFASLFLNDVEHFTFSFNLEVILMEFQGLDISGKNKISESMQEISRNNTIKEVQYNELRDNQMEIKITYDDDKEAEVKVKLAKAESINYSNRPYFYHIMTSPSEIIKQIEDTIQ